MLILPGSNALSAFRSQRLVSQLQAAAPHIAAVQARFVHCRFGAPLSADDTARLAAMLTYGEPAHEREPAGATEEFIVIRASAPSRHGRRRRPTSPTTAA
jgi:phosphoribosylformylglycinamidine synthase